MPNIDKKDFHWFMGVKFALMVSLFYSCAWWLAALITIIFLLTYRNLIAKINKLHVMDIGDYGTFVTNHKAPANIMSVTPLSIGKPEYAKEAFMRVIKAHVKARTIIVKVLGDMYYKELPDHNAIADSQIITLPDGHLKTQEDVEKFISEHVGTEIPLGEP